MRKFANLLKISSYSQLIKGISRVLQKLLKNFNGTIVSTSTILPSSLVWPVIFVLKLNEFVALAPSKPTLSPALFTAGISLQNCHKFADVF